MGNADLKRLAKNILPYGIVKKYREKKASAQEECFEPVAPRDFYTSQGEKVYTLFLKDHLCAHQPWGFVYGRTPKTILWDRIHPGLDVHFYTHSDILATIGKPKKKFAYLIESEMIVPEDYTIFERNFGLSGEFDLIFTHSDKLLNKYANAKFLPPSGVWYGNEYADVRLDEKIYEKKEKDISIVASDKQSCELHKLRKALAYELKDNGLADTFGAFDGGKWVTLESALSDYRYQIVIENAISDYYFTEKILNCFASMTIPVYIGAGKIGEYFNTDGIICVDEPSVESVLKAIKQCSEKHYCECIPAILDNFKRVQDFLCVEDYLVEHYGDYLR